MERPAHLATAFTAFVDLVAFRDADAEIEELSSSLEAFDLSPAPAPRLPPGIEGDFPFAIFAAKDGSRQLLLQPRRVDYKCMLHGSTGAVTASSVMVEDGSKVLSAVLTWSEQRSNRLALQTEHLSTSTGARNLGAIGGVLINVPEAFGRVNEWSWRANKETTRGEETFNALVSIDAVLAGAFNGQKFKNGVRYLYDINTSQNRVKARFHEGSLLPALTDMATIEAQTRQAIDDFLK